MKRQRIQRILLLGIAICIALSCIGCIRFSRGKKTEIPIKKLAYDTKKKGEHIVYIKEGGEYEPYFVLTKKYYGKTLLMRYYVLDQPRAFNIYEGNGFHNAYYPNSLMDCFLSNDFFHTLSPKMQELILEMDIDITTEESIAAGPILETEKLRRKIFLLSAYEVDAPELELVAHEGIKLKYFADAPDGDIRIGHKKNGETTNYWLRSAHTWDDYTVTSVSGIEGIVGSVEVNGELAVRPIFCIEGDTPVYKKKISDMKTGYVIE
ncbi:hypothetical protein HMPREF0389_01395 [Filifactor alocis ATCC 35896]|uniref:DUF6273 domain-containing protein n=1 Tax=Filifactor alocis (strain ATCC 35896 / CCUG 47790 / D40 B5) TaxID=546269 RepID=D6GTF7_FILAD|nr:DUF6273 domain-containing protein [Filifactor alocis]EFE27764.1 hypothetical protein HMPREF0389_01395 [Filifactor alocis ATCC 35896]